MKWEMVKLGDVATYINGYAFKPNDWKTTGLPIIRIQNLTGNDYTTNYYQGDYNPKYEIKYGDILISWSASLGIYEWKKDKALLNQHIFKVLFNKLDIHKKFFYHTVTFLISDMIKETHGATMKHITKAKFDNMLFPYPPLDEQKRIADILDKADVIVQKRKESLALADEYIKSVFIDMFGDPVTNPMGWDKKTVEKLADVLSGYPFKSVHYTNNPADIPLCGGIIIYPSRIEWKKANYWPRSLSNKLNKYTLFENDIVLAMDRPWISEGLKIAQIDKRGEGTFLVQRTARIRAHAINQNFLYYNLKSSAFTNHCKPTETTVPHISSKDIQTFQVISPPLHLQEKFAQIVEKVEKTKEKMQKQLDEAENLFKALQQEFFG